MTRSFGVAAGLLLLAACGPKQDTAPTVQTAAVQRRDIVIDAQATGVVEAINIVEIKSKASGMITRMPVETGTIVRPGDLIVQVDTRDVQNQVNQAQADYESARARLDVARSQKARNDELFKARVITAQESETASLDLSNAQAALIRADAALDLARQRLEDATVAAPIAGVILEKTVAPGVVIASATGSVSGGTTLVKMADLSQVRVRALFNETDIGLIRAAQPATVTVDAFAGRPFTGIVEKIEPQAVINQNVTMFPVLVTLDNQEGLLKPGMNGEVSVLVDQRSGVLAVPNDAIRNTREAGTLAPLLGLDPDTVQEQIRQAGRGAGPGGGGAPAAGRATTSPGDVVLGDAPVAQGEQARGGRGQQVQVTPEECAPIMAAINGNAAAKKKLDDLRAAMSAEGADRRAIMMQQNEVYTSLKLDPAKAGACRRQAMGGGRGGNAGGATGGNAGASAAQPGRGNQGGGATRGGGAGQLSPSGEFGANRGRMRTGLVFVKTGTTFEPRVIQLGPQNYDFTEVVRGLAEGDEVVMMGSLALQAQRQQNIDNIRARSGGLPGMGAPPGGGGTRGGGGGGGNPGGGGGGGGRGGD